MVPNLLSPHPLNAPLLPLLRFRASSLSSPRREIGLMKLKGMGLSQHCGFQWHCLILPPLLSVPPAAPPPPPLPPPHPKPSSLRTRITVTIYNTPHKRSLSHTLHQCILLSFSGCHLSGRRRVERKVTGQSPGAYGMHEPLQIISQYQYGNGLLVSEREKGEIVSKWGRNKQKKVR